MGGVRLYLALDDAAYWLADRIVRPVIGGAPFGLDFLTAFAMQVTLVFGAVGAWRATCG